MTAIFEVELTCIILFLSPLLPHIIPGCCMLFPSPISFWDVSLLFFERSVTAKAHHSFVGFQLRRETCPLQQHQEFKLL